jgi:hypothetical protein
MISLGEAFKKDSKNDSNFIEDCPDDGGSKVL